MADLYASAFSVTVIRHLAVPPKPPSFEGAYNERPYDARGWPTFESAVSTEVLARVAYYPALQASAFKLLPPKVIDIGEAGPVTATLDSSTLDGRVSAHSRIEQVRASLAQATFTGKGDRDIVTALFDTYIRKITNAMVASGELVAGDYSGEYNALGQYEGYGVMHYRSGNSFEGEWKAGMTHGKGIWRWANGTVLEGQFACNKGEGRMLSKLADGTAEVSTWNAHAPVGEGVRWSADRQTAWRLRDGRPLEAISLERAREIAQRVGLPEPECHARVSGTDLHVHVYPV